MAWEFYRRMPVYLSNGHLLGHANEIGHAVDVVHVQEGHLLVRDWYVPAGAIRDVTPQGIYLSVDRADLRRSGWNVPPEEYLARQGSTPGYEYTSRADIPAYGAGPSTGSDKSEK
jgi:hypothetical protein